MENGVSGVSFHVQKMLETWMLIFHNPQNKVQLIEKTGSIQSFEKLIPHDELAILDVISDKLTAILHVISDLGQTDCHSWTDKLTSWTFSSTVSLRLLSRTNRLPFLMLSRTKVTSRAFTCCKPLALMRAFQFPAKCRIYMKESDIKSPTEA